MSIFFNAFFENHWSLSIHIRWYVWKPHGSCTTAMKNSSASTSVFSYWHIQIVKNKHAWRSILIDSQKIQFAPSYPGNGWIPHQTGDDGGRWPGVSRRYFFHPRKYSLQPAILASGTFLARSRCYWQDIHISKRPHVVHSFSSSVSVSPLHLSSLLAFTVETVPTLLTTILERIQVGAADW